MSIFEIDRLITECVQVDENGEVIGIDSERLAALQIERDAKLENIGCWYKNLVAEKKARKEEVANQKKAIDAIDKKLLGIENYLSVVLNGTSFVKPKCTIKFGRSVTVEVDESTLPKKWLKKVVSTAPDKIAIRNALKAGTKIRGAWLEEHTNISIK